MSFSVTSILRSHLIDLKPYSSARDEYKGELGIFLDANENPFGSVTDLGQFNRYPDPLQLKVKEALSNIKGTSSSQIFLGNGSDEPIDLLIRIFCEPGKDNIIQTPPTYGMYQVSADVNNVLVKNVPLTENFELQTAEILSAIDSNTKLIFICSPNNPSGNLLDRESILEIISKFSGIVVVDEAYIDFANSESFINVLNEYPNLLVLQTFSKAWGMANLRVGMAFASEEILHYMNKVKYPYNVNGLSQQMILDALQNEGRKNRYATSIIRQRTELINNLTLLPQVKKIFHSDANFLLVKFEKAKALFDFLIEQKIIVRDRTKVMHCEDCLRITVGVGEENEALFLKVKEFYQSA